MRARVGRAGNVSHSALSDSGPVVTVRVGEQMDVQCTAVHGRTDGSSSGSESESGCVSLGLLPLTTDGYRWAANWTLGAGECGECARGCDECVVTEDQTFVPHEYLEFRFADILGAPEPPTFERVRGWLVRYPFDGQMNDQIHRPEKKQKATEVEQEEEEDKEEEEEEGEEGQVHGTAGDARFEGQPASQILGSGSLAGGGTRVSTTDAGLNAVWELSKWTVTASALDANTDSNTRQRDVCTLDAFLQTVY